MKNILIFLLSMLLFNNQTNGMPDTELKNGYYFISFRQDLLFEYFVLLDFHNPTAEMYVFVKEKGFPFGINLVTGKYDTPIVYKLQKNNNLLTEINNLFSFNIKKEKIFFIKCQPTLNKNNWPPPFLFKKERKLKYYENNPIDLIKLNKEALENWEWYNKNDKK